MLRLLLLICWFMASTATILAEEVQYTFSHWNEKDGLKNNIVFCFLKDSRGVLWVGTQNGLNRFDGNHFITFRKNREGTSLPHNTINCLAEDPQGNIWGGTVNGVFKFSPLQHRFETYFAPKELEDNIVSNIQCDQQGNVFAATSIGILLLKKNESHFKLLAKLTTHRDSLDAYILGKNRMLLDESNQALWMATKRGILQYRYEKKEWIRGSSDKDNTLFSVRLTSALSKSPKGYFWFSDNTSKQLVAFNPSTGKIIKEISFQSMAPDAIGVTTMEDREGRLWLSTWSYDFLVVDLNNNNTIERLSSREGMSNTVASNFFWAATEDENGTIWLGTVNGISVCNPGKYLYKASQLPSKIPELSSCVLHFIKEDPEDATWWMVTNTNLIIHYFPTTGKSILYPMSRSRPNTKGAIPQNIFQFHVNTKQVILLTDFGTWQLNTSSGWFEPVQLVPPPYDTMKVMDFKDIDSLRYVSDGTRLLCFNTTTKQGRWISSVNASGIRPIVHLLHKPNRPFYWAMSRDYIETEDVKQRIVATKLITNDTLEAGGYFHSADMDQEGNIWVSNKGVGLYRYNPSTKEIKYWTDLDGLMDNHLHAIKADNNGLIWMLYFNRAGVFNPTKNSFTNFIIPYSESRYNYFNNLTLRKDGVIMGNVNNDIFEFFPDNLNNKPIPRMPLLSMTGVSGREYFLDAEKELTLKADENSLRFKFGMVLNQALFPHDFEYKLEGLNEQWVTASGSNEANYSHLPSGDYVFQVRAKGQNNAWISLQKSVHITIETPFYRSRGFLGALLLSVLLGTYFFYRYQMKQKEAFFNLKSKTQLLEKEKTMVMYESLKQQLNPHFLFNSLTSLSGLIATNQQTAAKFLEQMSGIYRYILKNGNYETVTLKDEMEFAKLYIDLQQTRFSKGFQVDMDIPFEYEKYKIAPVTLQNMIENAMKHNIIDEDTPLCVAIFIEDDYVVVKNNLQRKNKVETSNKKGLEQFITLYGYLTDKPVHIEETETYYSIKIPLI